MHMVTTCTTELTDTTKVVHPSGMASWVINHSDGFESWDVVGNVLNSPSIYGSYSRYPLTLTDPSTGRIVEREPMFLMQGAAILVTGRGRFPPGFLRGRSRSIR